MSDTVNRYLRASAANDIPGLMSTLAPDAEFVSPLSARMVFKGKPDIEFLLTAVYGALAGLRWGEPIGDHHRWVAISEGRAGPFRLDDAMAFEVDAQGLITRLRPHLRPWLGTTFFALMLGPKIARRPGVLRRALKG